MTFKQYEQRREQYQAAIENLEEDMSRLATEYVKEHRKYAEGTRIFYMWEGKKVESPISGAWFDYQGNIQYGVQLPPNRLYKTTSVNESEVELADPKEQDPEGR